MTTIADALAALAVRVGVHAASAPVDGRSRAAEREAGEQAAAVALAAAGSADRSIGGRAEDGCPRFPAGFAGSIAHTAELAVAVAAPRSAERTALGVDVEVSAALSARDAELVLASDERDLVAGHAQPDWCATVLWSAKEAAFKAWSAATGGLGRVDPVDLAVTLDETSASLVVRATGALRAAVLPYGDATGAYGEAEGLLVTVVQVAEPATAG